MATKPEYQIPKIPELHFKPEGYVSTGDKEFRDQFMAMLVDNGLDPANCVFRGFDGKKVDPVQGLPRDPAVYAMNLAGWNQAIRLQENTPADWAVNDDEKIPCVAVYDKSQLTEVYSAKHINPDSDDMSVDEIRLDEIVKGDDLDAMEPDRVVDETVVHKNFPDGSPTDALLALVYLDES